MSSHNKGHKQKGAQNATKKKRQAEHGRQSHKNKYEKHSHAAAEQARIAREGEDALNVRICRRCNQPVRVSRWMDHRCNNLTQHCWVCGNDVKVIDWDNHRCNRR